MVTDAGSFPGDRRRIYGVRKALHALIKVYTAATLIPGQVRGAMIYRSIWILDAPSTRAASSRATGTESMKFFRSQMEKGREMAARKNAVNVRESVRPKCTNMVYTGTRSIATGSPVEKRMMYRKARLKGSLLRDSG